MGDGTGKPINIKVSQNHILPSFNLRFDFSPKWVMRLAASKAMSRPDMGLLRSYLSVSQNLPGTSPDDPRWIKDAQGKPLPYVYLAFVSAQDDDIALCGALLSHVYNGLCGKRYLYALAALHDDDPLLAAFDAYPGTTSIVRAFEVDFSREPDLTPAMKPQRACIEFALT